MPKPQVIIYSRPNCHLCDVAKQSIEEANCAGRFTLEIVNIENDPELQARYGLDIPVVTVEGHEEFRHRVDPKRFCEVITKK